MEALEVYCRVRPLNAAELLRCDRFLPRILSKESIGIGDTRYAFNRVFTPEDSQEQVYEAAASKVVSNVLSGFNGTIFAYGQTSSGKTHTMEGNIYDESSQGVIPRIVRDIFLHIDKMDPELELIIKVSYFEIYNENIRDLLNVQNGSLKIREVDKKVYVEGITESAVATPDELMDLLTEGKKNRAVMATHMNMESSRSHSVFTITVQQTHSVNKTQLSGKLHLVDLAGSEKISKSGAHGILLKEARNINLSLTSLGKVIDALAEKKAHIPYRDSKLTRILQQSLGGNSRTTVIVCASPSHSHEAETKSTLAFGSRARTIKNAVVINEDLTAEGWKKRYEKEVCVLRTQLAAAHLELKQCSSANTETNRFEDDVAQLYEKLAENEDQIQQLSEELSEKTRLCALQDQELLRLRLREEQLQEETATLQYDATDRAVSLLVEQTNTKMVEFNALKKQYAHLIMSSRSQEPDVPMNRPDPRTDYLEKTVDNLTTVHKQLFRDNADLRVVHGQLEVHLKLRDDRIQRLEDSLRQSQELAQKERTRYHQEIESIKYVVYRSSLRQNTPKIIKPIRPNQLCSPSIESPVAK